MTPAEPGFRQMGSKLWTHRLFDWLLVQFVRYQIKRLQAENIATLNETRQTVSDVSYAGDEGGIVCHIVPPDRREALVVALTHLRVSRTMPLASAVVDYQKHRVKKLKKQSNS
jgi:hypothetical protein